MNEVNRAGARAYEKVRMRGAVVFLSVCGIPVNFSFGCEESELNYVSSYLLYIFLPMFSKCCIVKD